MRERTQTVGPPEPNSAHWIKRTFTEVSGSRLTTERARVFAEACEEVVKHETWRHWTRLDGSRYASWEEFVTCPEGMDTDLASLARAIKSSGARAERAIAAGRECAKAVGRPRNDEGKRKGGGATIPNAVPNTVPHTIARLKRDAPELVSDVVEGRMSAAAARREAGFAPKSVRVSLHENTWTAAKCVVSKLGAERARELAERILKTIAE